MKEVILTPEGYTKLKEEIENLSTTKRREVAERIKLAREFGDITENSEYDDAKNEQAMLEHRIALLEERLAHARVIEADEITSDVVGMVGVRRAGVDTTEAASFPLASEWQQRGDVAELRRIRVAPEHWRQGIGARLTETVIEWSRDHGFHSLVLSTTAPQLPAQALYTSIQKHFIPRKAPAKQREGGR